MATFMSFLMTQLEGLSFISLCILLIHFVRIILSDLRQFQKFSISRPPTYPVIGCLISFYKNRHRLLDWYTELLVESTTQTIVVDRIGACRTIVTANPENVRYILKTNFDNFPKGKHFSEILGDFLGNGIFNVDGDLWRTQRKLASHEFTGRYLRELFMTTLEEEVKKRLLPVLEAFATTAQVVDLQDMLRRFAFNMVLKVSLGIVDKHSLDPSLPVSPLARAFDLASATSARRGASPLSMVWKIKRWFGIGSERILRDAVEEIHRHVTEMIVNRRKTIQENKSSNDLLSRLILAGHEEKVIRDMVISFIMAGRDTTSAAMTWLFWLLSCHPDIEHELVKEAKLVTERTTDYDSLKELRLLKACLNESMRLYPPVAWDSKHAIVDDLLPDNTPVRAGDRVTYFQYGMGRMEALWGKDCLQFKPERWFLEPDNKALRKECPYKFPVFQAGPRVCLGQEMAFTQMNYVMASILGHFEIRPVSSETPAFVPLLTAHMAGGLKVLVQKRTQPSIQN